MREDEVATPPPGDDIAIIGMACLFPAADGAAAFWANIVGGVDAIGAPPAEWDAGRYLNNGAITTAAGGFLNDLYRFDAAELGVMPSSVDGSEPDQFLALRIARAALADAGYLDDGCDHSRSGIILGHSTYLHRGNANVVQHGIVIDQTVSLLRQLLPALDDGAAAEIAAALRARLPAFNADVAPGLVPNVMTGRIANRLNLCGPNYLIDAACASALLAVGAAMEELRSRRADLMLAGSVNASLPAEVYMVFSQLGALSRSSRVRPFSAEADGTLLGEGLGVVVLKRLADAVRAGDRVYAVLKAVGQASDGRGLGLLAPNVEGEALAIRRAYEQAGVAPATIGLIEAHGTGIPLGDRTEIAALRRVFGERQGLPACAIGSVKSMIGHCIPAAGIAGLIKAALALHYRVLPPTLCGEVNPALGLELTPFYVNSEARPWISPPQQVRRAAVSAFGFGGINSHAVLEEAPASGPPPRPAIWPHELALFAGENSEALIAALTTLSEAVADGRLADAPLAGVCLGLARAAASGGGRRLAIVASDLVDLAAKAAKAAARLKEAPDKPLQTRSGTFFAAERLDGGLAFVFPGEGAQYEGMLADVLHAFPEARAWFDFWDGVFADSAPPPRSASVFPPPTTLDGATREALRARLFGLEVGSESMFIASQALLAVLKALRLEADAMVGHSSGENSALLAAGAFAGAEWAELGPHIRGLNRLYNQMAEARSPAGGALLAVGAVPRERLLALADGVHIHLALDNCHHQAVLYGPREMLERLARELGAGGGLCAFLPFDRPYHTPLFAETARAIERLYADLGFRRPATPLYSCATAGPLPAEPEALRAAALAQWSSRVRFTETIERMHADGFRYFVEVGPSSTLTGFIDDILRGRPYVAVPLDSQRRAGLWPLLNGLARLWVRGRDFAVDALFAPRGLAAIDPAEVRPSRQRVYANTLPVIRLPDAEAARLRALIDGAPAPTVAATPAVACASRLPEAAAPREEPTVTEAAAPWAEEPPAAGEAEDVLSGHFALMRAFLASQQRILTEALAGAADDAAALPFLHHLIEETEDSVTAGCTLAVGEHGFLLHHVLYAAHVSDLDPDLHGLAVVPLAVSLEMAAEVASLLASQPVLARFEDVRAHDWIALDDDARTLTLTARRLEVGGGEERIAVRISDGDALLFEAEAVFAAEPPHLEPALPPLATPRPPTWEDEELYTSGMFHGPLFHSIAGLAAWDETGLDAALRDTPTEGFLVPGERPRLLLNPVLLDAIGHVTAFWIAQHLGTDFSSFPSRIARIALVDAAREDTAGAVLRGRLAFAGDGGPGEGRYLAGDFEAIAADGHVLFRASGWQDRFFEVPRRFFFARFRPRDGWYGEEVTAAFPALPGGAVVWLVPAFPPRFLDDAGAIWRRVLAHTVLSRAEREAWRALPAQPRRRTDWLMGRIALKEVVRHWLQRRWGVLLLPADIEIGVDNAGKPFVSAAGLEAFTPLPEVSMAHAGGAAVAVAAPAATAVGIDLEPLDRVIGEDLLRGAFTADEQRLLGGRPDEAALLRAWCAKEAAAKCLGEGLNGRPQAFALTGLAADQQTARVRAAGHDLMVTFADHGGAVLAVAVAGAAGVA